MQCVYGAQCHINPVLKWGKTQYVQLVAMVVVMI